MSHMDNTHIRYTARRGDIRALFGNVDSRRNTLFYAIALGLAALLGSAMATSAAAQASAPTGAKAVEISSEIQVERTDANGKAELVAPSDVTVVPGDRLLFTLTYRNAGSTPAANFVAVNPVHKAVRFTGVDEDWAAVSVDGGKTWGKLSALAVDDGTGGTRPAQGDDVTHIQWKFAGAIPAGKSGKLRFRGVVK